jgi:hypothetical protein
VAKYGKFSENGRLVAGLDGSSRFPALLCLRAWPSTGPFNCQGSSPPVSTSVLGLMSARSQIARNPVSGIIHPCFVIGQVANRQADHFVRIAWLELLQVLWQRHRLMNHAQLFQHVGDSALPRSCESRAASAGAEGKKPGDMPGSDRGVRRTQLSRREPEGFLTPFPGDRLGHIEGTPGNRQGISTGSRESPRWPL